MSFVQTLLGRPLSSEEEGAERVGLLSAVYGLDALGSAAYGPEAALTVLIPAGLAGVAAMVPLRVAITLLLLRRYHDRAERIAHIDSLDLTPLPQSPVMLVPISRWNKASSAAVQFACSLSNDVRVLHITDIPEDGDRKRIEWQHALDQAAAKSGQPSPQVISICSPYRSVVEPLTNYVAEAECDSPETKIAVVIAEVVASYWYHNYRAMLLRWKLLFTETAAW